MGATKLAQRAIKHRLLLFGAHWPKFFVLAPILAAQGGTVAYSALQRGDIETNDTNARLLVGTFETNDTNAPKNCTKIARFAPAKATPVSAGPPHRPAKATPVSRERFPIQASYGKS